MKEKLNIDKIFAHIGEFGGQQKKYVLLLGLINLYAPQFMIQKTFVGKDVDFTCHLSDGSTISNECPHGIISNCQKIEFDTQSKDSIVSEWNLVCDKSYLTPLSMTVFMFGVMMGSLALGSLADKVGRKKTLIITFSAVLVLNGAASGVTSFNIYLFLKFATGFFKSGYILAMFVLMNELIGASKRGSIGCLLQSCFSVGIAFFSLMAYYITFWRRLTLAISLFGLPIFIMACFILPESPRWLLNMGRVKESIAVLKLIASGNKTKFDHKLIDEDDSEDSEDEITIQPHIPPSQRSANEPPDSWFDLFTDKFLLKMTLIQIFCWFVNGMAYYGLTLAAGETSKDSLYWGTAISGLVELPAYFGSIFTLKYFNRTTNILSVMIFAGIAMLSIPLLQSWSPSMAATLGFLGKLGISASFAFIYIHSSEFFPTSIRNASMGLVSVAARVGGMVAPFMANLGQTVANLHFIVFGILSLISGLTYFVLPDTKDQPLPENLKELKSRRIHVVSVQSPQTTYKKVPLSDHEL